MQIWEIGIYRCRNAEMQKFVVYIDSPHTQKVLSVHKIRCNKNMRLCNLKRLLHALSGVMTETEVVLCCRPVLLNIV